MSLRDYVVAAFGVVSARARNRFKFAVLALAAVSLLDLLALMLVVVITSLGTESGTGGQDSLDRLPDVLQDPLASAGVDTLNGAVTVLGLSVIVLFVGKAFMAARVLGRVLRGLAREEAAATSGLMVKLMHAPLTFHLKRYNSEVMIDATIGMECLVMKTIAPVILIAAEFTLMLMLGIGLVVLAPLVAIGALLYFSAVLWILHNYIGSRAATAGRMDAESTMAGVGIVQMALTGFRDVKIRGAESYFIDRFSSSAQSGAQSRAQAAYLGLLPRYFLESALVLGMAFVFLIQLAFTDFAGALAGLALFAIAGFRLLPSLQRVQASASSIKSNQAAGERALRLLDDVARAHLAASGSARPPAEAGLEAAAAQAGEHTFSRLTSGVRLKAVSFTYPDADVPALSHVDVLFPAGQMSALVGPSGSGKSTLVDILLGLFDPSEGQVFVDDVDVHDLMREWRRVIGYVPQQSFLMPASIRINVAFGVEPADIDDSAVWSALERASLAPFVAGLPDRLEFELGDEGSGISGGQRQRLSLARALYHSPGVLILDEATSSLDVETEAEITQTLTALTDLTKIVVAHRLSTVRDAEQVLFLRDGKVEARGTFEQVRRAVPDFARQVQLSGLTPSE